MNSDWLNATDNALSDVSILLIRATSLALKGSNETLGTDGRAALASEVEGMLEQAVAIANTRHGDHYLFSGFQVDTPAFDITRDPGTGYITSTTYKGDSGLIMSEVEPGIDMAINIVGDSFFTNTFNTLINLRDALVAAPFDVSNVAVNLDDLETQLDDTLNMQASIGIKVRRLESTIERMETAEVGVKELLSEAKDADMAEVISHLNQQQFVYQTALSVNVQVLRTSLLDFLR